MKHFLIIFFLLFSNLGNLAAQAPDSLITNLDTELEKEEVYLSQKRSRIQNLKQQLSQTPAKNLPRKFELSASLYEEYKSFNYDTAFLYVNQLQDIAYALQDPQKINEAKIKLGFILLSSGMFKETFDTLKTVNKAALSQPDLQEYFALMARAHYDLADFNKDNHYTTLYTKKGNQYIDSLLAISAKDSYHFLYFRGLRSARNSNVPQGLADLEKLNQRQNLTLHQAAVVTSTLSDLYLRIGEVQKAVPLLAQAAIYDLKSSTKETAAILTLADLLHDQGDIARSYQYTKKALDDANFYGARHRKIQVGTILPILEEEKLSTVENHRKMLIAYSAVVTLLVISIIIFILIILKQLKKLRLAKQEIDTTNTMLQITNAQLQETNSKLIEANRIKEEYIGYYFNINSEYIDKIAKFKRAVDQNLMAKKYENLQYIVNNINLAKEREELFLSFDKVFVKLFPHFVNEFNAFFQEEDQIKLADHQTLNTDLRIFALIRLGIHENDKIAKILGYSVNTIYAYKTRIKNKSILPNEEFEKRMLEIKPA